MMYLGQDPIGINNTYYDLGIIADDYSELIFPIRKGQGCIYDKKYYIANQDINISEEWTEAHWDRRLIGEEIEKKYERPNDGIPASDLASGVIPSVPVQDVQINNSSILSQGVANVPYADADTFGLVQLNASGGITKNTNTGKIQINGASDSQVKSGNEAYRPLTPYKQHMAAFYGMATAAGDSTQASSSNAVGVYTDAAKIAIQKMLGIYEPPFELVNDITLEEESGFELTASDSNTPYNFRNVIISVDYPENHLAVSSGYGRYYFYDGSNNYANAETGRPTANQYPCYKFVRLIRQSNVAFVEFQNKQTSGSSASWQSKRYDVGMIVGLGNIVKVTTGTDHEPAGTRIRIWAQWAY